MLAGPAPLYAFDFDGTLARIVRERHAATMTEPVRAALAELSGKAVTAGVFGRSLDDLRVRVNGVVPHMIGEPWDGGIAYISSCHAPGQGMFPRLDQTNGAISSGFEATRCVDRG